jgi:hypothetical protein
MPIWDRVAECQHEIHVEFGIELLELLPVRMTHGH